MKSNKRLNIDKISKQGLNQHNVGSVLQKLPPEVITKVLETVNEVINANKLMQVKDQEFQNTLYYFREKSLDKKEKIQMLKEIISNPNVPEDSVAQIVSSICKIAENNNE